MKHTEFYDDFFKQKIFAKPTINKHILFSETYGRVCRYIKENDRQHYDILDVGCGPGHMVGRLLNLDNVSVTGCDITEHTLAVLREVYPTVEFYQLDLSMPLTLDKQYDVITAVEVIEHIPYKYQKVFIQNCFYALKPGGMLVLTTPNSERISLMPYSYRKTQPVEDWLSKDELRDLLIDRFTFVEINTCILYFPNIYIDALFKRIFYYFHIWLEQRLIENTSMGVHLIAAAKKHVT